MTIEKNDKKEKFFLIYTDYKYIFNFLTQEEKGNLLDVLLEYVETEQEPNIDNKNVANAFLYIKNRIDDNRIKQTEIRNNKAIAGKKSAEKRWGKNNTDQENITENNKSTNCDNIDITENKERITEYNTPITDDNRVITEHNYKKEKEEDKEKEEKEYKEKYKKENSKEKNSKKEIFDFSFLQTDEERQLLQKWLDYKKERRETYKTQSSIEQCFKRLATLSNGNIQVANAIIDQSIANNWSGLFALKSQVPNRQRQLVNNDEPVF